MIEIIRKIICCCIKSNFLSTAIALAALIVTFFIPIRIMKYQNYASLCSDYKSIEFAHAFQSVIEFFYKDCNCHVEEIPAKYYDRYQSDFARLKTGNINKEDVRHYQRRLLNDYFYELECCRESSYHLRRKITKDWTTSEAYVIKILICMNKAVDDNSNIMMDISAIKHQHAPKVKGISEYLERLYNLLKNEKSWM